jgi:hypothetical protein
MVTEYGRCPAFGYECEYVAKVEAQAAEIERLIGCLAKANTQAEHFEREWYLRGDRIEAQADRVKALEEGLDAWHRLIVEGGVPRYTITPGAALNTVVTWTRSLTENTQ